MSDTTTLAQENIAAAEAIHATTRKQQLRSLLLRGIASIPIPPANSDGKTILLIRPDHLGDVLLTSPAVQALSQAMPDARLVALVGPWSAGIISAYPEIDLTLTIQFPGFARNPARSGAQSWLMAWQQAQRLRKLNAQAAIIFRPDHWWGAMMTKLAGVPRRIGFDLPDVAPFLTQTFPLSQAHAVEHNMKLVSPWTQSSPQKEPTLTFPVEPADRMSIREKLDDQRIPAANKVIIHPGSGTLIKQWAPSHWAYVADHLSLQWNSPVIFTGSDHEIALVNAIIGMMQQPAICLAGETNVYQLAALYENATVVLGPDSGPMHLAAAVNAPTVTLFGPADPGEFRQWGPAGRHEALTVAMACRPCRIIDWPGATPTQHPCVRDINPDDVLAAAKRVAAHRA